MKLRKTFATLAATAAALATVIATPSDAHPATGPIVAGNGWKLNAPRITHIDTKPWRIAFHDTASRTKLTPYLRNTAAELSANLGVKFTVTTDIVKVTEGVCVHGHTISYRYMSKPNPDRPNQSFTGACSDGHGAADGAYVFMNSDYWLPTRNFSESTRMNVIWHETGHAVGLSHPATCPRNSYNLPPLMCDTGIYKDLRTRRYTSWERTGFRHLVANRAYTLPTVLP